MNPLIQAMGGNTVGGIGAPTGENNLARIMDIAKMLKSGNPEQIAHGLMLKNPQFKAFVDSNKGKTPEQVARENGIDLNQIIGMIK